MFGESSELKRNLLFQIKPAQAKSKRNFKLNLTKIKLNLTISASAWAGLIRKSSLTIHLHVTQCVLESWRLS